MRLRSSPGGYTAAAIVALLVSGGSCRSVTEPTPSRAPIGSRPSGASLLQQEALTEGDIRKADKIALPPSVRAPLLTGARRAEREHPDIRLARRARTIADLARIISERRVKTGLRRTLWAQAQRLESLARKRLAEIERS